MKNQENEEQSNDGFVDLSQMNLFSQSTKKVLQNKLSSQVTLLDLSSNHMNEECATILATFLSSPQCNLRSLSLIYCHLNHKSTSIIFKSIGFSPLYELYVDNNIINVNNCTDFAESLSNNPPLKLLSLVGCQINSDGFIKLFEGLPKCQNLQHLRFDSNSMLDPGAQAFANIIPQMNLLSLGVSDNEIWRDGTNAIIQSCTQQDTLFIFDIGYNIVDFDVLSRYITQTKKLVRLGISGSKIYEEQLNNFLLTLGKTTTISTILLDGINFHHMPISWGSCVENIYVNQSHLDSFVSMISTSSTLKDVRLGFLDLEQLQALYETNLNTPLHFVLSLHNFGKTGNTWLITFPEFEIESPCDVFNWNSKIQAQSMTMLLYLINNAKYKGQRIEKIDLRGTKMNDEAFAKFFAGLNPLHYKLLDISNNELRNNSIDSMIEFLAKDGSYIETLQMQKTRSSPNAYQLFFIFLSDNLDKSPKSIAFRVESPKYREETSVIDFATEIGDFLGKDPCLEELRFGGQITGKDAIGVISQLKTNHHLRHLEMQSDIFERYTSADPELDENLKLIFNDFVEILHDILTNEETQCILEDLNFPLLTELFIAYIPNLTIWPTIVRQLETNYNTNHHIG